MGWHYQARKTVYRTTRPTGVYEEVVVDLVEAYPFAEEADDNGVRIRRGPRTARFSFEVGRLGQAAMLA